MPLWTPEISAPFEGHLVWSVWKKALSWKRAEPGITNSGKKFMRPNKQNQQFQIEFRRTFVQAARKHGMLDMFPWPGPIVLQVHTYFATPKTAGSWWEGREYQHRPDVDNLGKQIMDALNPTGQQFGAYLDDAQVVQFLTTKSYSSLGDHIVVQLLLYRHVPKPVKRKAHDQRRKIL